MSENKNFNSAAIVLLTILFGILLLLGIMFMSTRKAQGQSMNLTDYCYVTTSQEGKKFYIEDKAPTRLKNGNFVFWGLTFDSGAIILLSEQVDCNRKRARINGSILNFIDKKNVFQSVFLNMKSGWFPRTDAVSKTYITWVCY